MRAILSGLVVAGALVQFSVLSFDALAGVPEKVPVFAEGEMLQWPASGQTDAAYWVAPEILQYIEDHRDTERAELGILVNQFQVNSKQFIYLVYTDYPHVHVQELATMGWEIPAYPRLFSNDFVVTIEPTPRYDRRPDTVATIDRLLNSPDDTFHRAFDLAQAYPLPDGRQILLYQRRLVPFQGTDLGYYEMLMADLDQLAGPADAVLVTPPEQVYALGRFGEGALALYPFPAESGPLSESDMEELARLASQHDRLWVVRGNLEEQDPAGLIAEWLAENAYQAYSIWHGPLQLVLYAPGSETMETAAVEPREAVWEEGIRLQGYRAPGQEVPLGQILRLELLWQASKPVAERYKVFLHLVDAGGRLVAQRDSEPASGNQPTAEWPAGEPISDKHGLWLPADLPAGDYEIVLGLYHAETGERLLLDPAAGREADAIPLATVRVEGDRATLLALDGD
jgi:hypothetical protein